MPTLFAKMAGGNWSAAGTWSNTSTVGGDSSGPPTAADDCVFDTFSGAVTIDVNSACRSIDCGTGGTAYANTLTHAASVTLSIGDATAGAGSIALRFSSGMTYTKSNDVTSVVSFVSTSTTEQSITSAGKTFASVTFDGVAGSWRLADAFDVSVSTSSLWTLTNGSVNTDGKTVACGSMVSTNSNIRTLSLGASVVTVTGTSWNFVTATNLTFNCGTSSITLSGAGCFLFGGSQTYNSVALTGSGTASVTGSNTFANLTRTGTAAKTDSFSLAPNQTVTTALTMSGNSSINRLLVKSSTLDTPVTLTAANVTCSYADFRDIVGAGAGSWNLSAITGLSGDCGGNSGITFTSGATQTWSGTSGGNWSANAWTSRVPLPQDDVVIASAFSGSQTVTLDMPRAGKSINWTGATGTPDWAKTSSSSIYGSITLIAGMTLSGTSTITLESRGSITFTSAGLTWTNPLTSQMVGGSMALQDAFLSSSTLTFQRGNLALGNFNCTCTTYNTNSSVTRALTSTGGILVVSGTGTVFNATSATGLTATGVTISITNVSSSSKTFAGGGGSYGTLTVTTSGTGAIILTGANTFVSLAATGGSTKTFTLPGSTTTTLTGATPFPSGAAGNLLTFGASAGSSTVSFSQQASADYVSLTNIVASGTTPAYAGTHSTDGGGNTNWTFADPPAAPALAILTGQYRRRST